MIQSCTIQKVASNHLIIHPHACVVKVNMHTLRPVIQEYTHALSYVNTHTHMHTEQRIQSSDNRPNLFVGTTVTNISDNHQLLMCG